MIKLRIFFLNNLMLVFVFLSMSGVYGQTTKDATKTPEQTEIDSLIDSNNYEEGIVLIQKIISNTPETDYKNLAKLYNELSFCQLNSKKIDLGKENAEKALELCALEDHGIPEEEAKGFSLIGNYYDTKFAHGKSIEFYKKALQVYLQKLPANYEDIGKSRLNLASAYVMVRNLELAQKHVDSAKTVLNKLETPNKEKLQRYHLVYGSILKEKSEYEDAISQYQKAIEISQKLEKPNWRTTALVYTNLGSTHYRLWQYDEALVNLEKALEIYLNKLDSSSSGVEFIYNTMASIYGYQAYYTKALNYNKKSLNLAKDIYGEIHPRVAFSYAITASTFSKMNEHKKVLENYNKALEILLQTVGEKHRWVVTIYESIGLAHYRLEDYELSLKHLKNALRLSIDVHGESSVLVAYTSVSLANTYDALGMESKAIEMYNKGISIQENIYQGQHRDLAQSYLDIGLFYFNNNQIKKAIESNDKVLKMYSSELQEALSSNDLLEYHELTILTQAVEHNGRFLLARYKNQGMKNMQDLMDANAFYKKAQFITDKMRHSVFEPSDKIRLTSFIQAIPKGVLETSILLGKQNKSDYLNEAFVISDKNKASTLKNLLYRSTMKVTDEALEETIHLEAELKKQRAGIISNIKNKKNNPDKDTTRLETYDNQLFQIGIRNDSLLTEVKKNHPKYYSIEYTDQSIAVQNIQHKLDANTTLLEYFQGDSTLYAFVITKNSFTVSEFSSTELTTDIEKLRTAVQHKDLDEFKAISNGLYKNLVASFAAEIIGNKLIIVPDGPIWHLNFDLLLTEQSSSKNPKDLPYLLKDYAISYANSASYLFGLPSQKAEPLEDCLAFSFSDSLNINVGESISLNTLRNSKKDLPGSRMEISEIAKIVEGDYFYGSKASEANFKKNASNYGILHLAIHGEVDDKEPENSRLFFTKNKDSVEDGYLYGHELFAMNLPAELTVLSACSTGDGKIAPGEGMMSLGNAFQYAGSKSLLMTHWEISDEIAPHIMKLFYTNLKNGMDKATALQQAKISYLKDSDVFRSDPFYWGSFYLVGDTSAIAFTSSNTWIYVILVFIVLVFGIFFLKGRGSMR